MVYDGCVAASGSDDSYYYGYDDYEYGCCSLCYECQYSYHYYYP